MMDIPKLIEDLRAMAALTDTYTYEEAADALESLLSHARANAAEIESLRQQLAKPADARLIKAAKAVVERWETPLWKDAPATQEYIYKLRDALNAIQGDSND
jgi:DNA-binding transcriptional regulator YiaG